MTHIKTKYYDLAKEMEEHLKCVSHCMQQAIEEDPEASKNWNPEQIFEKGAYWAARQVIITEIKD